MWINCQIAVPNTIIITNVLDAEYHRNEVRFTVQYKELKVNITEAT